MKKIVMGLLVVCTMLFMTNVSMACDCGCNKATISESVECSKNCDCGCQNGEECKCNKSCDKEKCEKKKECCKKCPCGCQNGEKCKCKKECDKSSNAKCDKEKSLLDEIKDSTAAEEISQSPKSKCCKKSKKCCKKFKKFCKKAKCAKKCKKLKQKCKKGCPLEDIIETEEK